MKLNRARRIILLAYGFLVLVLCVILVPHRVENRLSSGLPWRGGPPESLESLEYYPLWFQYGSSCGHYDDYVPASSRIAVSNLVVELVALTLMTAVALTLSKGTVD
jgi:hypothetical protein